MPLDPAEFEARGFVRDAEEGLFYQCDELGRITLFGLAAGGGEVGEGKVHEVEILPAPVGGTRAVERSWTQTIHPHPDADPTTTLDAWALEVRARILLEASHTPVCSFCGKTNSEVAKLIAGPTSYICNECVALCNDIISIEMSPPDPA